jgi:hypothetical protein
VWSGNAQHKNDANRSIALQQLIPHLPPNCDYFCLQKDVHDDELALLLASNIRYFGNDLADFSDTAALCDLMDTVVSVDTSVAHLAGAMGKPTRVLLPYLPDWRWMLDRADSPWYASVTLCRQGPDCQWGPVLARLVV